MAERNRFSCTGKCAEEPGGSLPEIFSRTESGIPKLQIKETFPEILYNEYGEWKYLPAGKVSQTTKDDTHKNKTSPFNTGGMETEISDCKQGSIRKIFCKSVVRL